MQPSLFASEKTLPLALSPEIVAAIEALATNGEIAERGAIFTRYEVVEFILDLVGYKVSEPLHKKVILEPSFGEGDFLIPIVDRLLAAWLGSGGNPSNAEEELSKAVFAVELHRDTFLKTRDVIRAKLVKAGLSKVVAESLCHKWLYQGDFLVNNTSTLFDFIVGNPPYVRQELIATPLLNEYRRRFKTMYDRADLYVAFIEHSLTLLRSTGILGFICADRWMKNRYGGPLRAFISAGFSLKAYVDMVETNPFSTEVSAYPGIFIIDRSTSDSTRVVRRPRIDAEFLVTLAQNINSPSCPHDSRIHEVQKVVRGSEPWLLESADHIALIRRLEKTYPSIEEVGCRVGIGVATGADSIFIGKFDSLDVEPSRKLPLVATSDIETGEIIWSGRGVINPFDDGGGLVDLVKFPRLANYLRNHEEGLVRRHCAKKNPSSWYRTIDRIWPALTRKPKLLIPDIKGDAHIILDPGQFYPHHNLYYVLSDDWNIKALQAVLLSSIAKLFVRTYSTKMRGGYYRFQAQYLRRIRIPKWEDVSVTLRKELIRASDLKDKYMCNRVIAELYGLSDDEKIALESWEKDNGN